MSDIDAPIPSELCGIAGCVYLPHATGPHTWQAAARVLTVPPNIPIEQARKFDVRCRACDWGGGMAAKLVTAERRRDVHNAEKHPDLVCGGCGDLLTPANKSTRCDTCCSSCAVIGHPLTPINCVILTEERHS